MTQNLNGFKSLVNYVIEGVEKEVAKVNRMRLRRGLRHGHGKFNGTLDYLFSGCGNANNPSIKDIQMGRVASPSSIYHIGRYMGLADRLLRSGIEQGDMERTMTGANIYSWLGQGDRQSVRNGVAKCYQKSKEISAEYGVPLFDKGDRRIAIIPTELAQETERYLNERPSFTYADVDNE